MLGFRQNIKPISYEESKEIRSALRRYASGILTSEELIERKRIHDVLSRYKSIWK